ncbi:MAG: tetratricopeptide repeat protein [Dongiaceae bacterium]
MPADSIAGETGSAFDAAVALHRAGQDRDALALCETALVAEPARGEAWQLKAVLLSRLADSDGASAALARAIALDPENHDLRFQDASLLIHLERKAEAIVALEELLSIAPDRADAVKLIAALKRDLGDVAGAIAAANALVQLRPDDAAAWISLGWAHYAVQDWPQTEAAFRRAAALDPASAMAHRLHAMALVHCGDPARGLAAADRALALDPGNADAEDMRATALRDLGRIGDAMAAADRALARDPAHRGALMRRGLLLHDGGDPEAACIAYDRLLALDPGHVDAHWNRGAALLALGRLREGFAEYEWRLRSTLFYRGKPRHAQPRWDGSPLAGRAILIHAEQGFGDTIQFLRYLPLLAAMTDRVFLEVPPPLKPLVAQSGLARDLFGTGETLPDFDCRASLMSLPHLTGVMPGEAQLPAPYLRAEPRRIAQWRARLERYPGPRIGLCWRGNPLHTRDRDRSLPLDALRPLFDRPLFDRPATFIGLQQADASPEIEAAGLASRIVDMAADMDRDGAFLDTAALMMSLDLVVTVDTAIAHLAGALGRPALLLLHKNPDFRWMLGRSDTLWYPSLTVLRQQRAGDWSDPVAAVSAAIPRLVPHG